VTKDIDDGRLAAFLDRQLDDDERQAVEAALAADPAMRERLALLASGGLPFAVAFDAALRDAPIERMTGRLSALAHPRSRWRAPLAAAVAAAALTFVVGLGVGRFLPAEGGPGTQTADVGDHDDDWRSTMAELASLYRPDSFAGETPRDAAYAAVSSAVGVPLDAGRVALDGVALKRVEALDYEGKPLAWFVYLDSTGPLGFCIARTGERDAALSVTAREGLSLASWVRGGRGYLLVGRFGSDRAKRLAEALSARF
jgi:anti-sigma factor RsiW